MKDVDLVLGLCTRQFALTVERSAKSPSSQLKADQSIVENVIQNIGASNTGPSAR
jgi:hypothetical protein